MIGRNKCMILEVFSSSRSGEGLLVIELGGTCIFCQQSYQLWEGRPYPDYCLKVLWTYSETAVSL